MLFDALSLPVRPGSNFTPCLIYTRLGVLCYTDYLFMYALTHIGVTCTHNGMNTSWRPQADAGCLTGGLEMRCLRRADVAV
jgi:hypothetical protein